MMKKLLARHVPLILMVLLVPQLGSCGQYKNRTSSHLDEVKQNINADALQSWAVNLIAQNQTETQIKELGLSTVPPGLLNTSSGTPSYVFYVPAEDANEPYIWVCWGGGFGHWGLKLGSPILQLFSTEDSYVLPWQAGLYAWHEIQ